MTYQILNNEEDLYDVLVDQENECQAILIQTESMKSTFDSYPEILFVDSTYKLNDLCMPLYILMCFGGNGESEIIALALVQHEKIDTLT